MARHNLGPAYSIHTQTHTALLLTWAVSASHADDPGNKTLDCQATLPDGPGIDALTEPAPGTR